MRLNLYFDYRFQFTLCIFFIVLINEYIYGLTCLVQWKGGVNLLRTLFLLEKYETNIDGAGGKRGYCWNILQWSEMTLKVWFTPMETTYETVNFPTFPSVLTYPFQYLGHSLSPRNAPCCTQKDIKMVLFCFSCCQKTGFYPQLKIIVRRKLFKSIVVGRSHWSIL